ncbi:MAG TPA: redoxin domain-containing protein [Chthoniobacteraceae bacterium]|jgi:thiol-disulfide isomerase/thioredoxin
MSRWILSASTTALFALLGFSFPAQAGLNDAKNDSGADSTAHIDLPKAAGTLPGPSAEAEDEEEVPELVGQAGPAFSAPQVGGGSFDLAAHKGKDVVVLDFWATWCGPCVAALPIITDVTNSMKDKGVVFCAVNEGDEEATIRQFLDAKKLGPTVGMDDGKIGHLYGVQGIPQTVIIDKQGVVQTIHIGFGPNLRELLTQQLEAVLDGKSLIKPKVLSEPVLTNLERVWVAPGKYNGIAADAGKLYAIGKEGHCDVFDASGKATGKMDFEDVRGGMLRTAKLKAGDARQLLTFQAWGQELRAYDADGKALWVYSGGDGIDDVAVADLKGDGIDEVIVGYNGRTGLHVLNSKGKLIWKCDKIENAWHVSAGDLAGTGTPLVLTTSSDGDVSVFNAEGKAQPEVSASLYSNMVRVAPGAKGEPGKIIVGGSEGDHEDVAAFSAEGKKLWELPVSDGKGHIDSAVMAPGHPWLAISMRGGHVIVVDTNKGEAIAESIGEAPRGELAWLTTDDGVQLTVTGRDAVHAYRVQGK